MNVSIRLGHTDSVDSVDKQNFFDVELKSTSKLRHFTNIKETIDQFEQFKTERENCNKYRLILTINPYCTNVLFNTLTEIVYAEGSDKYEAIINDDENTSVSKTQGVMGVSNPNRIKMIMNTEYSKPGSAESIDSNIKENYVYHPGYDIFDNHVIRNKSFKIVNKISDKGNKEVFNTIADIQRTPDGKEMTYKRRESINDKIGNKSYVRHLYDYDDILQFENGDSINANLVEENGWYGFINSSAIQSRDKDEKFNEINIGRVLNDHKSCEFIDMYPDRTLYSFNPKYNKYKHRLEYNWDVILTYPYGITYDTYVVKDNNCNGLVILDAKRAISPSGETIILFRCLTKHGLKRGDYVRFFYKKRDNDNGWKQYEKNFIVRNVGNLDNDEKEYYFYINDMDFIRLLSETGEFDNVSDDELEVNTKDYNYRFARVVGNTVSKYYVRIFKKLPNFKYRKQNFPIDGSINIDDYIESNAKKNDKMVLFDKEQYKPAFETTIYTDDSTQVTFTDTIDVSNLEDNLGRPLTEIYATVIKTNRGHNEWYNKSDSKEIEFSHCFGEISEGLKFSQKKSDLGNDSIQHIRQDCGDISMLYKNSSPYNNDITINDDEFLGDIVEFNNNECIEKVIQPFLHRFNTAQRELSLSEDDLKLDNTKLNDITYHEIWSDDWDAVPNDPTDGGKIIYKEDYFSIVEKKGNDGQATWRPEGYYYQPHYKFAIREFGNLIQSNHYDIMIKKIEPIQINGIFLKIDCKRNNNVSIGDIIYLFDDENNTRYEFVVSYLSNKTSFCVTPKINPSNGDRNPWKIFHDESGLNWLEVVNLVTPDENGKSKLCFRRNNPDIPSYAVRVGKNKYLWRNVLKSGDMGAQNLTEYAYSNDAFYITNEINFFLRRQDPQGINGLYCKYAFPNDIYGNIQKESNYVYKEESEIIC